MTRGKLIFVLVVVVLLVGAIGGYLLLPKKYQVSENLTQAVVFWNDKEAFCFLNTNTTGRSRNAVQERWGNSKYGLFLAVIDQTDFFHKQDVTAYHLLSSGRLDRFNLPEQSASYGSWTLRDGNLQLTPPSSRYNKSNGFRWDGRQFVPVPPQSKPQTITSSTLTADDLAADDANADENDGFVSKSERARFKDAGWHYKLLPAFARETDQAMLPLKIGRNAFTLTVRTFPLQPNLQAQFDAMQVGTRSIELSGDNLAPPATVLWSQKGWSNISKAEYLVLFQKFGHASSMSGRMITLFVIALLFIVLKFAAWGKLLFAFGGVKKKVLQNMATAYSFPPAIPSQFPLLDLEALERYTRDFESMGFTRLMDFSLAADRGNHPPSFCRLLASSRYQCYAEVTQFFPRGKSPLPLKCGVLSVLQDGWTLGFSNRKPQAASSLLKRRRALGVMMPDVAPQELLQSFLRMRDQVCMELGISPSTDTTLEAYFKQVQRALGEMREAVRQKNFLVGVPRVYLRKLALVKTKPEYVWLGDYPKEAERRKQAYAVPAVAQ